MNDSVRNVRSCLASAERWRQQARALRDLATGRHLRGDQAGLLLREAEAADRQAEWWLRGAEEARAA